ncbi:MAG: CmcJ/NvfI family oxidoreductase [Cellvibrionaceae bacterium]
MIIQASVNYHVKRRQAQAFLFDVDGIVGNLISPELVETQVDVQDLRDKVCKVNFDHDGITFAQSPSKVIQFEPHRNWQSQYDEEITALLNHTVDAKEVIVFDHTLRVDNLDAKRKPARNVHNDYSPKSANQRLIDILGSERATNFQDGHFGFVNVWRPVEQTITTSPLGFILPSSMHPEDWMNIELIYPDRKGQILGATFNPKHEWFYQSNMQPNEVIIFNIYDNKRRPYLAHSALDIAVQAKPSLPRKSIETRTLVRYA